MKTTRQIYCQYLLSSQINYTGTNLADHVDNLDHNSVYRFLKNEKLTPALVWEKVKPLLEQSEDGCLLFDDTVLDKSYSHRISGTRRQYSGNTHGIVMGIGVVNLVYYNPHNEQYLVIDFRLFDPDRDGKSKLDHVNDMLDSVARRGILYRTVLMDSWYATTQLMTRLLKSGKLFYCPIKKNRNVDDSGGQRSYQKVEDLTWSAQEEENGKTVKLQGLAGATYLKLFRVAFSTERTEYLVTNDDTQDNTLDAQQESAQRWKVEQFHREEKQLTGIERCQCRLNRSQRNHICASVLVWVCLKNLAYQTHQTQTHQTVYQIKKGLLSDYLRQQLSQPTVVFG
jgi:hypothetical protein